MRDCEIAEHRRTLRQILAALAEIESKCGQIDAARALRTQAREIVDYIAAHAHAEQRAAFLPREDVREVTERSSTASLIALTERGINLRVASDVADEYIPTVYARSNSRR